MLQRNINKDLRAVSPKIVGPLSIRQSISAVLGGGLSILLWNVIPGNFAMDLKVIIIGVLVSPIMAFGWVDYNGLKFEDLIVTTLKSMILSPPIRKYKTVNELGFLFDDVKSDKDVKIKAVKKPKRKLTKKGGKVNEEK